MTPFRRRLRVLATAWILFQAASLSALVPRACCLAHQGHQAASSEKKSNCHEEAPVPHCPMPGADGTPCPMHRGNEHAAHERSNPADHAPNEECAIRGTCGGPVAALFTVLSNYGVLTNSFSGLTYLPLAGTTLSARDQLIGQFASPDAPPPRA
jgi:hypothetical protein